MEQDTVVLFLKWGIALFILLCAMESKWIADLIQNTRLSKIFNRIFISLVIFFVMRMVSSLMDQYLDLEIPYSSYVVNYAFWSCAWWFYFHRQRRFIASEDIGLDGRERLSRSIDEIIDELTQAQKQLTTR